MNRHNLIFFNNRWVPLEKAAVSPLDHGFLYGDGVFETIRSYGGHPFKLRDHLNRLFESCHTIDLALPHSSEAITRIVYKAITLNHIKEGLIRITCSRGPGTLGLDPALCPKPTLIIMVFPYTAVFRSLYLKGITIGIVNTVRVSSRAIPSQIKSSNFLNNILAKIEAKKAGFLEGIFLNDRGYVTEGTISNLFIVQHGTLITPSVKSGILEGVTRNTVIDIAKTNGIRVIEKLVKPNELYLAKECFITNTGYEIMPATRLNGKKIGNGKPGPLTKELINLFKEYVKPSPQP